MGAVADLPVPAGGAVAAQPVPDAERWRANAEAAPDEVWQSTAGEFRKGLRSSMISIGGALNALASGVGENLGLSEFAADRMKAAEADMASADAVGPRVRDVRGIHDLADVVDFTSGLAGETVGSLAPMVAGAAVGGLRGAAAGLFLPETGQQLFRTRNSPASAGRRLAAAGVEGAASTALGLAVPAGAARKVAGRAITEGVLKETGKGAGLMAAASGGQAVARQAAHTAVEPERDKSGDTAEITDSALGGALAGGAFGLGAGLAGKFQVGRARTLAGAKEDLGARERPSKLEPDLDKVPEDADGIGQALDAHDTKVDQELAAREGEPWAKKYEGWREDPEKRDAFHEAAVGEHRENVDRPQARQLLSRLGQFMDKWRPAAPEGGKASKVRTALDMAVFDNMVKHLPEHLREAYSPEEKLQLAEHVKDFALHTAGRSEELPGPGKPELRTGEGRTRTDQADSGVKMEQVEGPRERQRVVPHALMDIFGEQLDPLLTTTQKLLMQGGLRDKAKGAANFKKAVGVATRSRGRLGAGLDDVVRTHLRPEYLEDPEARDYTVRTLSDQVMNMVQSGKFDEARLDHFFGKGKQDVLDAFDAQREDITRGYESFDEPQEPRTDESTAAKLRRNENFRVSEEDEFGAGPAEPTEPEPNPTGVEPSRAEEAHPYRDKRLGVAMDADEAKRALEGLRSEEPAMSGAVRYKPVVGDDGRVTLHAEDGAAPEGFDAEARGRIKDTQGKAGHENGVVTVVMKDLGREGRNEQVPVSVPRLTAEAMRSGVQAPEGQSYVKTAVMEGLSRLLGDPSFVRLKEGNTLDFPTDMVVARLRGKDYTWGEVTGRGMSAEELSMKQRTSDVAEKARFAEKRDVVESEYKPQLRTELEDAKEAVKAAEEDEAKARADHQEAKNRGVKYEERKPLWKAWKDAERKAQAARTVRERFQSALDEVNDELDRRSEQGDQPIYDSRGITDTEEVRKGLAEAQERTPRVYQEETGAPVGQAPRAGPRGPTPGEAAGSVKHSLFERGGREWEIRKTDTGKFYVADAKTMAHSGRLYDTAEAARTAFMAATRPGEGSAKAPKGESTPSVLSIDQERTFREWQLKNPGKNADDWLGSLAREQAERQKEFNDYHGSMSANPTAKEWAKYADLAAAAEKAGRDYLTSTQIDRMPETTKRRATEMLAAADRDVEAHNAKVSAANSPLKPKSMDERTASVEKDAIVRATQAWNRLKKLHEVADQIAQMGNKAPRTKLSEMRLGKEPMSEEDQARVRGHVEKVLGPKAKVFFEAMDTAGKFFGGTGEEALHINVHALDPLGVGFHESAHALLARLAQTNKESANVLMNAARSPKVLAQLRKLLADHPGALKQLADPEEAAAYMYEFWAHKALEVGPQTDGVFSKVKDWLHAAAHMLLGVGEDRFTLRQADDILREFHSGRLADRSVAAEALLKIVPRAKLEQGWLEKFGDWADRVGSTADGYIRDQKIPAFSKMADQFLSPIDSPGTPSGMMQTRHRAFNQFMNRYAVASRGLDDKALGRVLESLQRDDDSLLTGRAEKAAKGGIRSLLDDMYDYMQDKGVRAVEWNPKRHEYEEHKIERVANFFQRAYDRSAIDAKRGEFEALLAKYGVENPKEVVDKMLTSAKGSPDESDASAGLTYYAPNTMARTLKIPDAELAPFMKKDLGSIMYDYVRYVTRRGEYASRFGNQGQRIAEAITEARGQGATDAQVKQFSNYVQAMEGTLGNHISLGLRKFFSGVLTYQNWRLLPLSLFSSLVDPNGIIVRGGTVGEGFGAFARGVKDLFKTTEDESRHFARLVGAVTDATEEHMVSDMYGMNFGSKWQKWLNDKLFKYNGMESWNNSMRTAAAAAARNFIIRHATEPTKHSERWLSELGLKRGDVHVGKGDQLDLTPQVVDAVNKWVDGAVLRPHAATRPIYGSDPHYMLIIHLKQFAYSFQKTIVAQTVHETMQGNFRPLMVLSSYVPFIVASDVLRSLVTPGSGDNERYAKWGFSDWLQHGVNRAGIDGPSQYLGDSMGDMARGKSGLGPLLGPSFQQLEDVLRASFGAPGTSFETEALRSIPLVPTFFPGRLDRIANED